MEIALVVAGVGLGMLISHVLHLGARRRRRAPLDLLTGVPTRAAVEAALKTLQPDDAVVMLDVDTLKATNDTLGHAAGDGALAALADHLRRGVRAGDTVARFGGDEFVLVLRAGGAGAAAVLERLRVSAPTPFSAGISLHRGGDGNATLAAADGALLAAKRAGGARVVSA